MPNRFILLLLAILVASLSGLPGANPAHAEGKLPRFASLGSDKVNVRTGPGKRYPIQWVYVREGLPVEIIAEFEQWRKIRDEEGDEGWVHSSLLSGRRMVTFTETVRAMRLKADAASLPVLFAQPGVLAELERCDGAWCAVAVGDQHGYARREHLWGLLPDERFD
ncbi:SH3 domain-containing protein [Oceanibacterium hippocampi]|uniref:Bacterial SH3 domain protein n=1 Tax=Oceanibacterium hippocampi TaxID=745714 RepID=A0A1Y5RJJ8_9PROT|nr:SH3 domain-containing protein [Oceanibacterium hippocampi]SLN18787.1 Bacterial SH3 domain protein [Oceanibacterium hippocampi]